MFIFYKKFIIVLFIYVFILFLKVKTMFWLKILRQMNDFHNQNCVNIFFTMEMKVNVFVRRIKFTGQMNSTYYYLVYLSS